MRILSMSIKCADVLPVTHVKDLVYYYSHNPIADVSWKQRGLAYKIVWNLSFNLAPRSQ